MKRTIICVALCLLSSNGLVSAAVKDEAEALVRRTLLKMYQADIARVWESFSEPSKDEFRKVYLKFLTIEKETWKPGAEVPASPYDPFFSSEEVRRKMELVRKTPYCERELKDRGFPPNLDLVAKLDNRSFWETFLSEQYLKDKEYHAPPAALSGWPRKEHLPISYQVEGVAVDGERFFVIIMAPPQLQRAFYSLVFARSFLYRDSTEREDLPDKRFVWTGRISEGQLQLDVPQIIADHYKLGSLPR